MKLEKLNRGVLSDLEMNSIEGGRIPWRKRYKWAQRAGVFITLADAADRFVEGWNAVECDCK
jgi:hypothetical protein